MYKPKKIRNRSYAITNTRTGEYLTWDDGDLKTWGARKFALRKCLRLNVEAGYVDDVVFPTKKEFKQFPYNYCVHYSIMKSGLNDIVPTERVVYNGELFELFAIPYAKTLKLKYSDINIAHSGMTLLQLKKMEQYSTGDYFVFVGSHCMYLSDGKLFDSAKRGWDSRRIHRIYQIKRSDK